MSDSNLNSKKDFESTVEGESSALEADSSSIQPKKGSECLRKVCEQLQATCLAATGHRDICKEKICNSISSDASLSSAATATTTTTQSECNICGTPENDKIRADKRVVYSYDLSEPKEHITKNKGQDLISKMEILDERIELFAQKRSKAKQESEMSLSDAVEPDFKTRNNRFGLHNNEEKNPDIIRLEEDYNAIIDMIATEMNEYRNKYISSQQEVEHQKCLLRKNDVTTELIEDQINSEIQRIKDHFQSNLTEYAKYRQYLMNEQFKVARCTKEKEELANKLKIVCRELQNTRNLQTRSAARPDFCSSCDRLKKRNAKFQIKYSKLLSVKQLLAEKNLELRKELQILRSESAKTIVYLNEREADCQTAYKRIISELENELIRCRSQSTFAFNEQYNVIQELQAQLKCVCFNFMCAQKQINSLEQYLSKKGTSPNAPCS